MIEHCGRLPLVIILLGGLLAGKDTLSNWRTVHDDVTSSLMRNEGLEQKVSQVINLSYHDLPYRLKPCFLYLAHFPEDSEIPIKKLIRILVAEGLVFKEPYDNNGVKLEDIAMRNVDELMDRCMVQLTGVRGVSGRAKTCRLHDLMRDLCLQKAKEEDFLQIIHLPNDTSTSVRRIRRCSIHVHQDYVDTSSLLWEQEEWSRLRSLLFFPAPWGYEKEVKIMFHNFKLLRVLDLERFVLPAGNLPRAIGNLIHLRYFSLKDAIVPSVVEIPSSLENLQCLQTLDLRISTIEEVKVADIIWKMKRLKHLYLPYDVSKSSSGARLRLGNLHDLEILYNLNPETWSINHVANMSNLRKLSMPFPKNFEELEVIFKPSSAILSSLRSFCLFSISKAMEESQVIQIFSCHHLEKLYLEGPIRKLPELYRFPPNLTKLVLRDSGLHQDPMETLERLPNLMLLGLDNNAYLGFEMVCTGKGFPRLESLWISFIANLREWKVEKGAMPNLRRLSIWTVWKMKMIPEGLMFITTLEELKISDQPKEFGDRLREEGEDFYKIKHVPSITIGSMWD